MTASRMAALRTVGAILVVATIGATAWRSYAKTPIWDHWDVVKPGILYRSGELPPDQLDEAVKRYGLRTIVNLMYPYPSVRREQAQAKNLGVEFVNLPMPGDGFGREEQFRQFLEIVDDPARRPVLVHCARGTCRTSAAVGIYRYEHDGWTVEDVDAEMKRQVYRQGYLAGFTYEMVERRPFDQLVPNGPSPRKEDSDVSGR